MRLRRPHLRIIFLIQTIATKNKGSASENNKNNNKNMITRSVRQEMNPVPTVTSIGSNPKAYVKTSTRWMRRSVRFTAVSTASTIYTVNFQDIGSSLGATAAEAYTVKVLGVRVWNVTPLATTDNYVRVTVQAAVFATSNFPSVTGEDYGSGMTLPGVRINIPDLLTETTSTASTAGVIQIGASNTSQKYLCDMDIMFQM